MTFDQQVIQFYKQFDASKWELPKGIGLLNPFANAEVWPVFEAFYNKYCRDEGKRHLILGINPGRFGAGVTGISFTDPKILEEQCGIPNPYVKRNELSAIFIYEMIAAMGGIDAFYSRFFLSSVVPLGFVKDGKNINYYDDRTLQDNLRKPIEQCLRQQLTFGIHTDKLFVLGKGKNYTYVEKLNAELGLFDEVVPLPHPRWVMQYKLKSKAEHLAECVEKLGRVV
jgi:hypothetical protein